MQTHLLKQGMVLMAAVVAAWVGVWVPPAFAKKAPVEQTGQTQCFDASGSSIDCDGTGQDGDLQAGVPLPIPRFKDKGDGTVTDNLTGLIWLKDANCFGAQLWGPALRAVNALASGRCDLSDGSVAGDWRLPNIKELQSLIDFGNAFPALPTGHPFSIRVDGFYWSSTTVGAVPGAQWLVGVDGGGTFSTGAFGIEGGLVWPVREGQ